MRIQSPSLVELHAFLAVARTGSFRRAAQELCVTQAAVSRAVARLEDDLGHEVLIRGPASVTLSTLGAELQRMTARHVEGLEMAGMHLRKQKDSQRLQLAVITSLGNLWLMPRLEDFRRRHPAIDIEFLQYRHDEDFLREDVDLWIDVKRSPYQQWPRHIEAHYLIGQEVVEVCSPKIARRIRSAPDVLKQSLLYHSAHRDNWAIWARAAGMELPERWAGCGFDLVINMVEAARSGMGVAVVQECMVRDDLQSGVLVSPLGVRASTGRGYYLCKRKAQVAHGASALFCQWLQDAAGAAHALA